MDTWKPVGGVVAAGIGLVVVGALASLVGRTFRAPATPETNLGTAALVVAVLVVASVLTAVLVGTRDGGRLSTPYW